MRNLIGGMALAAALVASGAASAATSGGNSGLAFAALVGMRSPTILPAHKQALEHFLEGKSNLVPSGAAFTFHATEVHCHFSNVDLTSHSCTLTFGSTNINITGRAGNELTASMQAAGVQGDGAAGTIHFDAKAIACTINIDEIKSPDGGGASCNYTQN